jgi:hypothetical protein
MVDRRRSLSSFCARSAFTAIAVVAGLMLATAEAIAADHAATLQGSVESGGDGLAGYKVSLYVSFVDHGPPWKFLGSDTSKKQAISKSLTRCRRVSQMIRRFYSCKRSAAR